MAYWNVTRIGSIFLVVFGIAQAADQNHAALTKGAHDAIVARMSKDFEATPNSLFIFDKKGKLKETVPLPTSEYGKYKSLEDLLKGSSATPISSCDEPKPTPPPPKCVVCKSGNVICLDEGGGKNKLDLQVFKPDSKQ